MQITTQTITPAMASEWLGMNSNNRPMKEPMVAIIAAAIKRGDWQLNGDAIRFSSGGVLLDGQHRLQACIIADMPITSIVVRGLDSSTFHTIDTGKSRVAGDILSLAGASNANIAASIARMVLNHRNARNPVTVTRDKVPTNKQILEEYNSNGLIGEAASYVASHKWLKRFMKPSLAGFLYVVGCAKDRETTLEFLTQLSDVTHYPRHPSADLLRERIMLDRASKTKLSKSELTALSMKALRLFATGTDVRMLKIMSKEKDLFRLW